MTNQEIQDLTAGFEAPAPECPHLAERVERSRQAIEAELEIIRLDPRAANWTTGLEPAIATALELCRTEPQSSPLVKALRARARSAPEEWRQLQVPAFACPPRR